MSGASKNIMNNTAPVVAEDFSSLILDFLYLEENKTRSLADQILGESYSEGATSGNATSSKKAASLSAGYKALGLKGEGGFDTTTTVSELVTKNYYWKNAKGLIEAVRASDADKREPGSLVHLVGDLQLIDLNFVKELNFQASNVEDVLNVLHALRIEPLKLIKSIPGVKENNEKALKKALLSFVSLLSLFAKHWPSRVVGTFTSAGETYWFTLKEGAIQQEYRDSILRYRGSEVPGTWSLVGIVDSGPKDDLVAERYDGMQKEIAVSEVAAPLNETYRLIGTVFGIKPHMCTIMPVIIYRRLIF